LAITVSDAKAVVNKAKQVKQRNYNDYTESSNIVAIRAAAVECK